MVMLDFLEFSNTHFVMMFIVLKWLVKVHKTSKQMVASNVWSKWNDFGTQKAHIFKKMFFLMIFGRMYEK